MSFDFGRARKENLERFQLLQNLQQLDPVLESNYSEIPNGSFRIRNNLTMNNSKVLRNTEFLLYETDEQIRIDVQTDGDTRKAAMILPEGWKRVPLHTVAEVRTGLAKGKQKFIDCVEVPYLRVANVQDGHLDLREVKKIQVERASVERYSMKAGDVLMTEGGDVDKLGRGAVWTAPIDPCLHQNHVFVVRPHTGVLDSGYLAALSSSQYGKAYFKSCAKRSTTLASINALQVRAFPIILPPFEEQRQIAKIIGTWDEAIEVSKAQVQRLIDEKRTLLHDLVSGRHCIQISPDAYSATPA
ncbi:MAG: hypothetical protein JWQ41_1034 [Variovorax sp.]|nr:hypothetical protein [Variovorax sp.]